MQSDYRTINIESKVVENEVFLYFSAEGKPLALPTRLKTIETHIRQSSGTNKEISLFLRLQQGVWYCMNELTLPENVSVDTLEVIGHAIRDYLEKHNDKIAERETKNPKKVFLKSYKKEKPFYKV